MLRWDEYFGQNKNTVEEKPIANSKTNMLLLLIPWIVFWVAASIDNFWGSIASIFVCGVLPILFYNNKKTVYDVVSSALVVVFSILLLVNVPALIVMPLSYFAFGLIWSVSVFFKIPLTAEYSMNTYGGEKAFKNPLFIKTNRILTAAWGILYLITSIWTYFIMRTPSSVFIGLINSVLPVIMGIFTAWFQKWYPKKVARGGIRP